MPALQTVRERSSLEVGEEEWSGEGRRVISVVVEQRVSVSPVHDVWPPILARL